MRLLFSSMFDFLNFSFLSIFALEGQSSTLARLEEIFEHTLDVPLPGHFCRSQSLFCALNLSSASPLPRLALLCSSLLERQSLPFWLFPEWGTSCVGHQCFISAEICVSFDVLEVYKLLRRSLVESNRVNLERPPVLRFWWAPPVLCYPACFIIAF